MASPILRNEDGQIIVTNMISTAKASTMTPMGMMIPPPSVPSRIAATAPPSTSGLVSSLLSELSFENEAPPPETHSIMGGRNEDASYMENSSKGYHDESSKWVWNGLLCFSMHDPDMFFDAQERLRLSTRDGMDCNGKMVEPMKLRTTSELSEVTATSIESSVAKDACKLRGGQQQSPYQHPSASPQRNLRGDFAAFDQQPPRMPEGRHDPNQADPTNPFARIYAPPPPKELPVRFLRAGKGDPIEGQRRYEATLQWRKENKIDGILFEAHPMFEMVKRHYPHYFHLRGKQGEPVFFEQPPKTDLAALRAGGMDLDRLVRHYAMVTEFGWQFVEKNDFARAITVLDLEGMRMMDFAGEVIEYVKMCSTFTGQHYPERAGHVIVINVPRWFAMIWNVVKPMVDEVTLKKISIVRGKDAVFEALAEKIPVENIPPEYGGRSMPLGESPEEHALRDLMRHNIALANGDFSCGGKAANPPCRFCSWGPVRSY